MNKHELESTNDVLRHRIKLAVDRAKRAEAENERLRETLINVDRRISEANQWDWICALQLGRDIDPRLLHAQDAATAGEEG